MKFIRISADCAVFKRGIHELMIEGTNVAELGEQLIEALSQETSHERIIASFPAPARTMVADLLKNLERRRLLSRVESVGISAEQGSSSTFYWSFGRSQTETTSSLKSARVLCVGANYISRELARCLLELEIGCVTLAHHSVLDNPSVTWETPTGDPADQLELIKDAGSVDFSSYAAVCVASDFGEADALLEVNRLAMATRTPFLPIWLSDMIGYVGPFNFPFETACFRCYRLRRDANDRRFRISRVVRRSMAGEPSARDLVGFVPPMAGVLGSIASLEILKHLTKFASADSIGHVIEMNLISFESSVRRVLKLPRCPECSDIMRRGEMALVRGPLLPFDSDEPAKKERRA